MKRLAASVGLANLLLLGEWHSLYAVYRRDLSYFAGSKPGLHYLWSTTLAVLLLAAGLVVASALLDIVRRRLPAAVGERLVVAAAGIAMVEAWMSAASSLTSLLTRDVIAVGLLVTASVLTIFLRRGRRAKRFVALSARLLAFTALLVPVFITTVLVGAARYTLPESTAGHARGAAPEGTAAPRVVWIVFDELDVRVAFERRPPSLALPAFDRLADESLVAVQAYAPGRWTLDALPTLWTGRPVSDAVEQGPGELRVTFADEGQPRPFDRATTVFAQTTAAHRGVGIAGWYHPYCRLFGTIVNRCESVAVANALLPFQHAAFASERGTLATVGLLLAWHAPWSASAVFTGGLTPARQRAEQALVVRQRADAYGRVHGAALDMVRDPSLRLVFVHYPVPHLPGFSDSEYRNTDATGARGYFDNLALADRALAELVAAIDETGLRSTTSVLVQADHALRPAFWSRLNLWNAELEALTEGVQSSLVPFILRQPGQPAARYGQPFTTALAHDVVLEILDGTLESSQDVLDWLDANRTRLPLSWPVRTLLDRD